MTKLNQRDGSFCHGRAASNGPIKRKCRRIGVRGPAALDLMTVPLAGAIGLLAVLGSLVWAQGTSPAGFRSFNGCNHQTGGEPAQITQELGTGWYRVDFLWQQIEPQKGTWNWEVPDNAVRQAQSQNAQVLPILDYSAPWASSRPGDVYSPPKNEADWDDYVERVVSRYSAAPYNVRYYQVWNEPTVKNFLRVPNDMDYIDKIYLPAAKVIRKHNCYVVFGGWPISNSLDQMDQELEHNSAWQWTDIVDVHYFPMYVWPTLYQRWIANGRCKGIWQSEIGWNTFPNFLPNTYWRVIYWSLQQGWRNPDAYKVFWYDRFGEFGHDTSKGLTAKGPGGNVVLTAHGQRLAVMNELLGSSPLETFTDFTTTPSYPPTWIEVNPTVLGIRVGSNRIVIALLLPASQANRSTSISVALPQKPAAVELLSATGESLAVKSGYSGGHLQVTASTAGFSTAVATYRTTGAITCSIGYLKIDL